ncbi:MAG: DUF302 domain-containing protein, partial [Armatimonadota bacterium]
MSSFDITTVLTLPHEEALEKVRAALENEGFGIVSEIDVTATLRAKLGVDFRRYMILGVCDPTLANKALQAEPLVVLMM